MTNWPIERRWLLQDPDQPHAERSTAELVGKPVCCLLGAAGLGKTVELRRLESLEQEAGYRVRSERLAGIASSPDHLASSLERLARGAGRETAIYLDAVDEAMIRVASTSIELANWIRGKLSDSLPLLRISCRSAVWPLAIQEALISIYGAQEVIIGSLLPLALEDVEVAAASEGIDAGPFLDQIRRSKAEILARQPLTLRMLIQLHQRQSRLPEDRRELFERAILHLASERNERRELDTVGPVDPALLIDAAEQLACFTILSGREAVDLSDDPPPLSLGWLELVQLPSVCAPLDDRLLRAIGQSGLCEGDGPRRFRFVHRQIAEYLAGRRLAQLPLHQSRSLLASGFGWRSGVAGPLRETAAFAAIENRDLARWVAEMDPEVVGMSDVADDSLRRRATLQLLERFRRHELTDSLVVRDQLPLAGLQYPNADDDLRLALKERGDRCEDILEFAIALVEAWEFNSLYGDLADLFLDPSAPIHPRVAAGYVLRRFGSREIRSRFRPLIAGAPEDQDLELKGLALQCCWPDDLSGEELLAVLAPWGNQRLFGAYFAFLLELDRKEFDASGCRLAGLAWAKRVLSSERVSSPTDRIVQRIARGAVADIEDPEIAAALADLLLEAGRTHSVSPLGPIASYAGGLDEPERQPPLLGNDGIRRALIQHLVAEADDERDLVMAAFETPSLLQLKDFSWLLENAADPARGDAERENFATLASRLSLYDSPEAAATWLRLREIEPIRSKLNYPLSILLDSDEARWERKFYNRAHGRQGEGKPEEHGVRAPWERVRQVLDLAEVNDPRFFFNLCNELTLVEGATRYSFERFLTRTPGWEAASPDIRERIVSAARRILDSPTDEPEACRSKPLNSILGGYMPAVWLLLEMNRSWLDERPNEWWERWCWYFLRELNPWLRGEPREEKIDLFKMLHHRAGRVVRDSIVTLLKASGEGSQSLFLGLLELCEAIEDSELDTHLEKVLRAGTAGPDRTWHIARFLLGRDHDRALRCCESVLSQATDLPEATVARVASALLHERSAEAWSIALPFLHGPPSRARSVLGNYARFEPRVRRETVSVPKTVTEAQVGELIGILLEQYPPEADPQHQGAFRVSEDDSAVILRDRLIADLGSYKSRAALDALRELEHRFRAKYPWIRRPRSAVERAYRQSHWSPIPPTSVASLLSSDAKRLIRSGADAVDGIVAAIERFEGSLRHESPSSLEDLWNTPKGAPPTPKSEERISDKLCEAIRCYFSKRAVSADREVQVFRRSVPKQSGGAPGSEVDVLLRVPAPSTEDGDPIAIPIEVKRSDNREAKTGLAEQLVGRYMAQLGTDVSVFVVVWLDAPDLPKSHRPVWPNIQAAREYLKDQVEEAALALGGSIKVEAIVIDASLI